MDYDSKKAENCLIPLALNILWDAFMKYTDNLKNCGDCFKCRFSKLSTDSDKDSSEDN